MTIFLRLGHCLILSPKIKYNFLKTEDSYIFIYWKFFTYSAKYKGGNCQAVAGRWGLDSQGSAQGCARWKHNTLGTWYLCFLGVEKPRKMRVLLCGLQHSGRRILQKAPLPFTLGSERQGLWGKTTICLKPRKWSLCYYEIILHFVTQ